MRCHPLSHGCVYMDANIQVTFCLKNSFGHLSVSVIYNCVLLNITYGDIFWFKYRWKTTFEIWTLIHVQSSLTLLLCKGCVCETLIFYVERSAKIFTVVNICRVTLFLNLRLQCTLISHESTRAYLKKIKIDAAHFTV